MGQVPEGEVSLDFKGKSPAGGLVCPRRNASSGLKAPGPGAGLLRPHARRVYEALEDQMRRERWIAYCICWASPEKPAAGGGEELWAPRPLPSGQADCGGLRRGGKTVVRRAARFAQGGSPPAYGFPYPRGSWDPPGAERPAPCWPHDRGLASALAEKLRQGPSDLRACAEAWPWSSRRPSSGRRRAAHEKKLQRAGESPWAAPPPECPEARKKRSRPRTRRKSTAQAARPRASYVKKKTP